MTATAAQNAVPAGIWAVTTTGGECVSGYLPGWADADPSRSGVLPERLHVALADVVLEADMGGLVLPVVHGQGPVRDVGVLAVTMGCKPFGEDDEPRLPVVGVQVVEDFWIAGLDPEGVADLGQHLQSLGRHLLAAVAPKLAAARADWALHSRAVGLPESAPRS